MSAGTNNFMGWHRGSISAQLSPVVEDGQDVIMKQKFWFFMLGIYVEMHKSCAFTELEVMYYNIHKQAFQRLWCETSLPANWDAVPV